MTSRSGRRVMLSKPARWKTSATSCCASAMTRNGRRSSESILPCSEAGARMASAFAIGSLVRTRGREWVVLPESEEDFLVLRPLGGTDDEIAGIHLALEEVESATLPLPAADDLGDHRSGRLL